MNPNDTNDGLDPSGIPIEVIDNVILFYCDVDSESAILLNKYLIELDKKHQSISIKYDIKPIPIILKINSNGGCMDSGLSVYNTMKSIKTPITAIVDGIAASSASLIVLGADVRKMYKNSFILIHQISSSFEGNNEQMKDHLKNNEMYMNILENIYLQHTKIPKTHLRSILKKDLNINSTKCLRWKIVDEVI